MHNVHPIDRLLRALAGVILLELAYFWLSGTLQLATYAAGAVMLATASFRFCPLYRILGISTAGSRSGASAMGWNVITGIAIVAAALGGSYASQFFTRKIFLEDFNAMNDHYKQTLFLTGKNERSKANEKYDLLLPAYSAFQGKYADYRPQVLKDDAKFSSDLAAVSAMLKGVNGLVRTGDLHEAHLALEKVRPVFQDMFKRNGFSMLAVALVDFHDTMELMLDAANGKNSAKVVDLYTQVSGKLNAIETETNDAEIVAIRTNLDALLTLAKEPRPEALPAAGDALKSSFVKVYLKRG
jgi:hypothetical protein